MLLKEIDRGCSCINWALIDKFENLYNPRTTEVILYNCHTYEISLEEHKVVDQPASPSKLLQLLQDLHVMEEAAFKSAKRS